MRKRGLLALVLLTGACSSSHAKAVPVTAPAPGYSTPGAAAMGFFTYFVKGSRNACNYVIYGVALDCLLALESATATISPGFGIGATTISGSEGLVTVVGTFCVTRSKNTICRTNKSTTTGQPGSSKGFAKAYETATKGGAIDTIALPSEKQSGKWYLSLIG